MIIRHIESALFEFEEVVIPDFGAFIKEEVLAQIASENLKPIHSKIRFDHNAGSKASILASRIAKAESLTIAEAEREIAYWVAEAKHKLAEEGEFRIGAIGLLKGDELAKAKLEDFEDSNFAADAYGLPALKAKPVDVQPLTDTITKEVKQQVVEESVSAEKKQSGSLLIWFLVFAIVATLAMIVYLVNKKQDKDPIAVTTEEEGGVVFGRKAKPSKGQEEVVLAPEPQKQPEKQPDIKTEPSKPIPAATKEPNAPAEVSKPAVSKVVDKPRALEKVFHVIVGSFGNPDNAYKLSKELQAKGFEVVVIDPMKGSKLYKVSIGQFDSEPEAASFIKQKQAGFKENLFLLKP